MRKFFLVAFIWLYIFFLLGLIFNTSLNGHIFGKYSYSHFFIIIISFVGFIPYYLFIRYVLRTSIYHLNKKKLVLSPKKKLIILFVLFLLLISISEITIRSKNIYKRTTAENMVVHPFLQNKLRPNLGGSFNINSYGFRAEQISKQKPKNTYRIVILGGSTAYEDGIAYNNTAGKLLEDMLNKNSPKKIEVLNAGVSGYTSEHSLIDYMTRVSDFRPDLVIMWHGVNDMYASCANTYAISGPYQPDYSHFLGQIANMVASYFYPPFISIHLFTVDYALNFIPLHFYSDFVPLYKDLTTKVSDYKLSKIPSGDMQFPSITSYQRNLKYFITVVRSDNAKLILGNQPNMFSTDEKYHMTKGGIYCFNGKFRANMQSQIKGIQAFNEVTKKEASDANVPFIDLDAALPRTPEYFYDDIHWTNKGNKIAAEKLYNFIVSGNFIQ